MDDPGHRLPRRYRGDTKRERVITLGPIAPWSTTITVDALRLERSTRYEVAAEWVGPPAFAFPPSDRPVHARDCYVVDDLELARGLAIRATEAFAAGGDQAPDLRDLVAELRKRVYLP